ncbi:MAG: hypothetical protein EU547_04850, partial [Promethearchaeota archaeon]
MNRTTQRIIALVAIAAVAGVGIGVGVWYVTLPSSTTNPYTYPGLDSKPSLSRTIKIGVLDDMAQTGIFSYAGATLSAAEINAGGGVTIDGNTYYVGLVKEDTREASYDNDKAIAAAEKMKTYNPHAILGGFRSETFEIYITRIMDADIPFMITGSATTDFCQDWLGNPATRDFYKWLFRCMPLNSQHLGEHLSYLLKEEIIDAIGDHQGSHADNVWIVYEDLIWTADIKDMVQETLNESYPNYFGYSGDTQPNITVQSIPRRTGPSAWTSTEFSSLWNNIKSDGAQLVVPIISDIFYGYDFSKPYNETKPDCLIAGINVAAQTFDHWSNTEGGCEYEITTHAIAYVNFTERSLDWFD